MLEDLVVVSFSFEQSLEFFGGCEPSGYDNACRVSLFERECHPERDGAWYVRSERRDCGR